MISTKALKTRLLDKSEVATEYENLGPGCELARELIRARSRAGLTQAELADRMGTTQFMVARLESGHPPSMKTLQRFAKATGSKLKIQIKSASH